MIFRQIAAWALVLVTLIAFPAKAQIELPDWETVKISTENLGHGVYMLQGFGGNIGAYVGQGGVFLVDNEYAPLSAKIMAALSAISDQPVRFVVNTHWHRDHRGGNENFVNAGAMIIAHDETRRIMALAQQTPDMQSEIGPSIQNLPAITYDKAMTFHLGEEIIEVRYVPNVHTSGDSLVIFKNANIIQTGDMYFNGFYPFIDVPFGGSIDNMIAFYDDLYALADADTKIIPGHGSVANREDVRAYQNMLKVVRTRVSRAIAKGLSLEDLNAAKPLADLDPEWGDNLITADWLLNMVYADLTTHGMKAAVK
ncbi:MAG: MBL fold metallo-hydrolase [Robiginitomaculum sp.]|nr:MAG: MBL fold metallo-hydrolase [Robiginitomaculum sp.]